MNLLVIGSGGREHALIWKIAQSPLVKKIYAAPGNAGIKALAECVSIEVNQIDELLRFAKEKEIGLTVVGPESPLAGGIVNRFQAEGLKIFGPTQEAAQLESSKIFAKQLMAETGVPTAEFQIFDDVNQAKLYIVDRDPPYVIKADGLAGGKGVVIAATAEEGIQVVNQMIRNRLFGESGKRVVIEECLTGDELSVLLLTDGEQIIPLASAQDHKRAYDRDQGPNTGGMGAYSPCPLVSDRELNHIVDQTARPIIQGLKQKGIIYRGLLYVGLMMTPAGARVLEYNVRFGDPEAEAVLPRLKSDIVPVLLQIAEGKLTTLELEWDARACLTVVMASGGYPGSYKTGIEIKGLDQVKDPETIVFHAGTASDHKGKTVTNGGRVLCISGLGKTLKEAHDKAYDAIRKISFFEGFFRSDIGRRAFQRTEVA